MKKILVFLVLVLMLTACERSASNPPPPTADIDYLVTAAAATIGAIPAATLTPTATLAPSATPIPATPVIEQVRLASGVYLDWTKDADKYRQIDGNYLIPVSDIQKLDSGSAAILFEGEFFNSVGTHSICYLTGQFANGCKVENGKIHINQGSFWGYRADAKGDSPDDLLAVFAHDKWQNWHDQEIKGNPIEVYTSKGTVKYAGGDEPKLTPQQAMIVDRNAADRCPADKTQLIENPYSDAVNATNPVVIGAPGSFACRTLFVGKLTSDGNLVAYYWRGAKDGFSYVAAATNFYLVPESWGETEMKSFTSTLKATFLGQYK